MIIRGSSELPSFDLPSPNAPRRAIPRRVAPGTVPLVAVEGDAYDCGRHYAEIAQKNYPAYRALHGKNDGWNGVSGLVRRLYERYAPHLPTVFQGLNDGGVLRGKAAAPPDFGACTSFGVAGSLTLDGQPLSGQTKDPGIEKVPLYIALRMRIKNAPTILVLAYPGEVLGYGLWSTGTSIFRNSLYSKAGAATGLNFDEWGLLALASRSVHDALELAQRYGIAGAGNCLISDRQGESLSVEFNAMGVSVVPAKDGIATHGNHPEGIGTSRLDAYGEHEGPSERENSRYRMHGLWHLLNAERGRLTPQKAMMTLADHTYYPQGICRHWVEGKPEMETTAAVVAEPTEGKLHVVRGHPCANWATTYTT